MFAKLIKMALCGLYGVLMAFYGFLSSVAIGAIRSGSVYGVLWGVCSGSVYFSIDAAIQGAARLVVAPGAMSPAGFCILSAFRRGLSWGSSARFLFFHSCDGFGDPRRRSRSVGASASGPGSVARFLLTF